jgi:LEA14-like dessication related protein
MNKSNIQNPEVKVSNAKITGLSFQDVDLLFDLDITNPNSLGIKLSSFDYDFLLDEYSFMNGRQDRGLEIAANDVSSVQIPVTLGFKKIYDTYKGLTSKDSTKYQLNAGLAFDIPILGAVQIPVSKSGYLPLVKLPQIVVSGLKVEKLNFTGADLLLNIRVDNPNAFSMKFNNLNYQFDLNGNSIASGITSKGMTLNEKGEGIVELPISLNFLEMGQTVFHLLNGEKELNYNFKGNFDVDGSIPIFDAVNLPFDKSGKIMLSK